MDDYGEYYYKYSDKFIGYYKDLKHGKGIYYFICYLKRKMD